MWGKAVQIKPMGAAWPKITWMQELAEVFRVDASKDHEDAHLPHSVNPAEPAKPSWSPSIPEELGIHQLWVG